jgi:hypothetical protein
MQVDYPDVIRIAAGRRMKTITTTIYHDPACGAYQDLRQGRR